MCIIQYELCFHNGPDYVTMLVTHLVKKTHKMLHKKVCIDYCKILENVKILQKLT